jgi:hypothetical protein
MCIRNNALSLGETIKREITVDSFLHLIIVFVCSPHLTLHQVILKVMASCENKVDHEETLNIP